MKTSRTPSSRLFVSSTLHNIIHIRRYVLISVKISHKTYQDICLFSHLSKESFV